MLKLKFKEHTTTKIQLKRDNLLLTTGGQTYHFHSPLKCNRTTAHVINVCECMLIRSHTLIYVRHTSCMFQISGHFGVPWFINTQRPH